MAFSDPHHYLITYDIADPRRLARLHRYLKAWAIPVQYSVFTAVLRQAQVDMLVAGIEEIIHNQKDDVRIYPLLQNPDAIVIGQGCLPDGVHLLADYAEITFHPGNLEECVVTG
jgi:CRISPR-associated protein Cas2